METQTGDFSKELTILNKIAYKLREERFDQGAISFGIRGIAVYPLMKIICLSGMYVKERKDAHKLIEEFMLLSIDTWLLSSLRKQNQKSHLCIEFMTCQTLEKLEDFARFAGELDFNLGLTHQITFATSFNRLAEESQINSSLKLFWNLYDQNHVKSRIFYRKHWTLWSRI